MQTLTKQSFEFWIATAEASEYESGKYPVLLVSESDEVSKIVIGESDFEKYIHTDKQEEHELNKTHTTLPWVSVVPTSTEASE